MTCGTTNCSKCGGPAPTAMGICQGCRDELKRPLREVIEQRIAEWEAPIKGIKETLKGLKEQLEVVEAEIYRRELVINELRSLIDSNT